MRTQALSVVAVLVVLLFGSGCRTIDTAAASADTNRTGQVFLVRGLFDVFSTGLNGLRDEIRAEGVEAHTISGPRWRNLSKKIQAADADGELNRPLILVGHSYGADNAVRLARSLGQAGITVDRLALIDPTIPPALPSNVSRCMNLYKPNPATDWMPWLRGIPMEPNGTTEVVNVNVRDLDQPDAFRGVNHFNIDSNEAIHAMVLEEVLNATSPRGDGGDSMSATADEAQ